MTPTVSFVVPCYKLAHLLGECIESILCQTYGNFEVLIMDDCSPDNTPEVARSFQDPRVKYIRNDPNLGPLPNYNKGIRLSSGKYVWLISADDYLRQPYIVERYVNLLERNPHVGYTFCPGVVVRSGVETGIEGYSVYGSHDQIIDGHVLLKKLLRSNMIVAASAMARRECYEKISFFPIDIAWAGVSLNMVWAGDWYLWCLFALHFDVGYFAEPMVCYRKHDLSMTNILMQGNVENCSAPEVAVPWMIKHKADEAGCRHVSKKCLDAAANEYARSIASSRYGTPQRDSGWNLTLEQFEESLFRNTPIETERNWVRARVYAGMADQYYWQGELNLARHFYLAGLRKDPCMAKILAKSVLLWVGNPGDSLRRSLRSLRLKKVSRSVKSANLPVDWS
jgi:glycosyltransferase involved in cell wall biosynthesis